MLVQCDIPQLETKTQDVPDLLKVKVRAIQSPSWALPYHLYETSSVNSALVTLLPLPVLVSVSPQLIFNTVDLQEFKVNGLNFNEGISCQVDGVSQPTIFISAT